MPRRRPAPRSKSIVSREERHTAGAGQSVWASFQVFLGQALSPGHESGQDQAGKHQSIGLRLRDTSDDAPGDYQSRFVSQKVLVNRNDPLQRELAGVARSITYAPRQAVEPDEQELILLAQIEA